MTSVDSPPGLVDARYARWDGAPDAFVVVPVPALPPPGAGEVLVRIDLATVCGSDLHTVGGRRSAPVPAVLGHEQVGTVVAVGAGGAVCVDGTPVVPGLRVVWSITASCGDCDRCRRGATQKCRTLRKYGHEPLDERAPLTGGFATHCVLVPGTSVVAVPDGLPDAVVSPASCATATVAAVLGAAGPLDGCRVLVTGAGMLGVTASAMAARAGAHVVVVDPDPGRRRQAARFGAAEVRGTREPVGEVDAALELSGRPAAVRACLDALGVGGTAVLAGSVSPGEPVALDPQWLVRGLRTVVGVHNYRPADLQRATDFLAAHHRTYPFAELVGSPYPLHRLAAAVAAAPGAVELRQAVVPTPPETARADGGTA
ncbi:zinc-binding dehydrogenase [Yinghuangia sp. ASG 101]|uniref:zinc-binding dehydrogenase n=1 Tax=Yinghuangia sp. ASG 101 TaxID=2896848 RepID=UPI001E3E392B|nr:alcohol dehydrogenase catalytic domain-containing protein [Yinghuangia sp. ASG 101]UGQ11824.1 zinc-binding dehydrogenase [Yinghuangia sp. ASG 101]